MKVSNYEYKNKQHIDFFILFISCISGSSNLLSILFSNFSSAFCSQTSPQYPILKYLLCILFSSFSSATWSQTSQHPILKHLLCILFSNFSSASCSQTFPQHRILNHLPRILFSNINSVSRSQTSPQYTILKNLQIFYSPTSTPCPILKHPLGILFSNI